MKEIVVQTGDVTIIEDEVPGDGWAAGLTISKNELADYFRLNGYYDDEETVFILKHKADGATNVADYEQDEAVTRFYFTEEQYQELRIRLHHLELHR